MIKNNFLNLNKKNFVQFWVLILMLFLAGLLMIATKLVQQNQDNRSRAVETTNQLKVSFKFAFRGIKPDIAKNCFGSLGNLKVEAVNVPTNTYQSNITASFKPVSGKVNKYGDQVFQVTNLILDTKFSAVNDFNYLTIKGPFHSALRMCINDQSFKLDESNVCNISLKGEGVYDFSNYPLTPGDINQDKMVNGADYSIIKGRISGGISCGQEGDLNYDGVVNAVDIEIIKSVLSEKSDGVILPKPTSGAPSPTPTPAVTSLKLLVVSDIHTNVTNLKKILERFKTDKVDLVVLSGDLADKGTADQEKAVKNTLMASKVTYVAIPGNHDSWGCCYDNYFNKRYQSLKFGNIKLILIDNSKDDGLGKTQKTWIEIQLPECKKIMCLVVMHKPLNHATSKHIMGEGNSKVAVEAKWLLNLLVNNRVKQIITGHIHDPQTYTLGGLTTEIIGAAKFGHFSEFVVKSNGLIKRARFKL